MPPSRFGFGLIIMSFPSATQGGRAGRSSGSRMLRRTRTERRTLEASGRSRHGGREPQYLVLRKFPESSGYRNAVMMRDRDPQSPPRLPPRKRGKFLPPQSISSNQPETVTVIMSARTFAHGSCARLRLSVTAKGSTRRVRARAAERSIDELKAGIGDFYDESSELWESM